MQVSLAHQATCLSQTKEQQRAKSAAIAEVVDKQRHIQQDNNRAHSRHQRMMTRRELVQSARSRAAAFSVQCTMLQTTLKRVESAVKTQDLTNAQKERVARLRAQDQETQHNIKLEREQRTERAKRLAEEALELYHAHK